MISLAPIRYAEVLGAAGGPVERVEYSEGRFMGRPCAHATAYLRDAVLPGNCRAKTRTAQPDGAGSHPSRQIASHMAISEALERWAVYHCRAHPEVKCGMEWDGSSNGFAAFPGLFKRQARRAAFRESIERHCLICWWEGLLGHTHVQDPQSGIRAIQINNPFSSHVVVILWANDPEGSAIAFGAGTNLGHAVQRAGVELERTQVIVRELRKPGAAGSDDPGSVLEERIKYFSGTAGMLDFIGRLERKVTAEVPALNLLFDGAVEGPWSRYATVWRTVIEEPSYAYLSDAIDYFFW